MLCLNMDVVYVYFIDVASIFFRISLRIVVVVIVSCYSYIHAALSNLRSFFTLHFLIYRNRSYCFFISLVTICALILTGRFGCSVR
jgi:hypothetical protein